MLRPTTVAQRQMKIDTDPWVLPREGDKNAFRPSTSLSIRLLLPRQGSTTRKKEAGEARNPQRNTFLLSLTKSSHASAMQEGDIPWGVLAESAGIVHCSGSRKDGWGWGGGWNVLLACCSVQARVLRGGPWTSKVPFVPFRVAGQSGLW